MSPPPAEVGAGAEAAARAGDDDGAHVVVGVGQVEGLDQLAHHRGGEGVEPVGPVQRDRHDVVGDVVAISVKVAVSVMPGTLRAAPPRELRGASDA